MLDKTNNQIDISQVLSWDTLGKNSYKHSVQNAAPSHNDNQSTPRKGLGARHKTIHETAFNLLDDSSLIFIPDWKKSDNSHKF